MAESIDRFEGASPDATVKWGVFHDSLMQLYPTLLLLRDDQVSAQAEADRLNEELLDGYVPETGPEERFFIRALTLGKTSVETVISTTYLDEAGVPHALRASTTERTE